MCCCNVIESHSKFDICGDVCVCGGNIVVACHRKLTDYEHIEGYIFILKIFRGESVNVSQSILSRQFLIYFQGRRLQDALDSIRLKAQNFLSTELFC